MKRTIVIRDAEAMTPRGGGMLRPAATLLCALTADGLQWLLPLFWPVWDGAMVLAVLILWGWRWEVLVAIIPELIPGIELAPTWTIFAGYLIIARRGDGPAPGVRPERTRAPEKRVDPL